MSLKIWGVLFFICCAVLADSFQVTRGELSSVHRLRFSLKASTKINKRRQRKFETWSYNNSYRGEEFLMNKRGGECVRYTEDKASELLQKSNYAVEINGLFNILPLGFRVIEKIKNVINNHLDKIGSHCLHLSILQNKKWWNLSNRSKLYNDEFLYIYKLKRTKSDNTVEDIYGAKKKKFDDDGTILSPTCEELSLVLINKMFNEKICLKNLPILIHQFNHKFRNEKRMEKSLFKTKEFLMKDGYSFHANDNCLSKIYEQYKECYMNILKQLNLNYHIVKKRKKDKMNAIESHEFQILCRDNKFKEVAHIFKLGDYYSNRLNISYFDKKNEKQFLHMGCYGIGLYRLLYFLIDHFYDSDGIRLPEVVAPFNVYLISKNKKRNNSTTKVDTLLKNCNNAQVEHNYMSTNEKVSAISPSSSIRDVEYVLTLWLYYIFKNNNVDVYFDDTDLHFSKKLKYCDLIGIPNRIIINLSSSERKIQLPYDFYNSINPENAGSDVNSINKKNENILSNKLFNLFKNVTVEYKNRFSNEVQLISVQNLLKHFKIV